MRPALLVLCLSTVACANLQGNGVVETETRTVGSYDAIDANNAIQVRLNALASEPPSPELMVTAESNLLEYIGTELDGTTMVVDLLRDNINISKPMTVEGDSGPIKAVTANNASTVFVQGNLAKSINVDANNAAMIELAGEADQLFLTANNGGIVKSEQRMGSADVLVDNGAEATLCVTGDVTGMVANGGNLKVLCGGDISMVQTKNGGTVSEG